MSGSLIGIDADVPLEKIIQELLKENISSAGLQVLTLEGESLGIISRDTLLDYIQTQPFEISYKGGDIGYLAGDPILDVPLFLCDAHDPIYQRLVAIAKPEPPKCQVCNSPMKRVK